MRHCEQFTAQFTARHLGLLAQPRHQSLPRLGKTVHTEPQALHHFLAHAAWAVTDRRTQRLAVLRQAIGDPPFILGLDETGDRQQGPTTDSVATPSIGNRHTLANGVVSLNASGRLKTTTVPLLCRVFTPATRLQPGDGSHTKPPWALAIVAELVARGLPLRVGLAESLSGESPQFIGALPRLQREDVVAIRGHHAVWLLPGQRVRQTRRAPL